ncbi:unnamed protein product [Euphydryas editha]|uniref:FP protein C-terminal domain-containing protein n=1 Tax=Euphydryas editha TaxID=104508 RepID=A0AAU9V8R5_EUPED|nr:unnamed protein product [Euphydryas editha]
MILKLTTEKLTQEHNTFKKELCTLTDTLEFHSKEQSDLKATVNDVKSDVKKMRIQNQDIDILKQSLDKLLHEQNIMQQRERINNLEICGIPEYKNEKVSEYLISIAKIVGIDLSIEDIVHIHRVPTRLPNRPKNIVVKLKSTQLKYGILSAIKKGVSQPTKEAANAANYKYIWIRNCRIYVRRSDTSPSVLIRDITDLKKIK